MKFPQKFPLEKFPPLETFYPKHRKVSSPGNSVCPAKLRQTGKSFLRRPQEIYTRETGNFLE